MIDLLIILTLIWLIFAVIQDFKTREIANWVNFSLIIFGLAGRLFYSVFSDNYNYIIFGLFGLAIFFILGHLFYYMRLFAGGDAKLLIALGVILPIANTLYENIIIFFVFIITLLFAGGIYSLIYSIVLVANNKKKFTKEFKKQAFISKNIIIILLICALFLILTGILTENILILSLSIIIFIFPFLYIYVKSVEQSYMLIYIAPSKISIGDWLNESIYIANHKIEPHWEGLTEAQVELIKKHYKRKILIKQGIPFSPSFLIAFLFIIGIKYLWNSNWGFW